MCAAAQRPLVAFERASRWIYSSWVTARWTRDQIWWLIAFYDGLLGRDCSKAAAVMENS